MKKIALPLMAVGMLLLAGACSKDEPAAPQGPSTPLVEQAFTNVPYGNDPEQVYDIYLPAGRSTAKTKVVVLIHGGGWIQGDKADMDFVVDYLRLTHPDHAVVNINYVLADSGVTKAFPRQFLDLAAVLDQVQAQQYQLQVKPEFALVGASAGAHIALMYDYVYDTQDRVKLVADVVGPADFTDPYYASNPMLPLAMMLLTDATAYPPGTNFPQTLSPAWQASASSSPTILFHGATDDLVPASNGHTMDSVLTQHGVPHQLTIYPGGHSDWPEADMADMLGQISDWIDMYLRVE